MDLPSNASTSKWFMDGENFKCAECAATFPSDVSVELHFKATHVQVRTHACTECQISFKDAWHLKRHLYTHGIVDADTPQVKNTCTLCKASFPDSWHLNKHLRTHETGNFNVKKSRGGRKRGRGQSNMISMLPAKAPGADWGGDGSQPPPLYSAQQFLENFEHTADLKPEALDFYCGICGFGLAKNKFSPHSVNHLHDVFEVRKGKAVDDVESLLDVSEEQHCGQCHSRAQIVQNLLDLLEAASS